MNHKNYVYQENVQWRQTTLLNLQLV